jgi:hypothetical protein
MIKGYETPDLVMMQVCNGESVDIVSWLDAKAYLNHLVTENGDDIMIYMLNAPFDLRVLSHPVLAGLLERDRVVDVGNRHRIYKLAIRGYFEQPVSLANLCRLYLHQELPKPEDIRTGFTRETVMTAEYVKYAALDAVVTYLIGNEIPEQPTEGMQTRADLALDLITMNGMLVDREAWDKHKMALKAKYDTAIDTLRSLGFEPDASANKPMSLLNVLCELVNLEMPDKVWPVSKLRGFLYAALARTDGTFEDLCSHLAEVRGHIERPKFKLSKEETEVLTKCLRAYDMEEIITSKKTRPYIKLLTILAKGVRDEHDSGDILKRMSVEYNTAAGWEDDSAFKKPTEYLQDHVIKLEKTYGISFPRTPTGKLKVSKDEMWRLDQKGVKDEFLESHVTYKHIEKLLSTYMNDDGIADDGRVHARFNIMVKTGRTSSTGPNMQNLPSKDGIRELFTVPNGMVLVSIDYNQLELCSLAQHCYKEYGISRMRELINAELDLHSWFAGRVSGIITPENDYDGTEESRLKLLPILKDIKDNYGRKRKEAKAANFGFPGGMGVARFHNEACINGMYDMTYDQAADLRSAWFDAFPEMEHHMKPTECARDPESNSSGPLYEAFTQTGRSRRHCSYNSACNFPFQGLAADGAKMALWDLTKAGFKIVNFIHDEVLLEMDQVGYHEKVLEAQRIMVDAMKDVLPDVLVKTEAAAMTHWYKEAETSYDSNGRLEIWMPK